MIRAAELLTDVPAGTHAIHIAPSSNPTLAEIAVFTHSELGSRQKRPLALPRWSVRAAGLVERSMYELAQLAPIPPASSRRASWLTRSARGPGKKVRNKCFDARLMWLDSITASWQRPIVSLATRMRFDSPAQLWR